MSSAPGAPHSLPLPGLTAQVARGAVRWAGDDLCAEKRRSPAD